MPNTLASIAPPAEPVAATAKSSSQLVSTLSSLRQLRPAVRLLCDKFGEGMPKLCVRKNFGATCFIELFCFVDDSSKLMAVPKNLISFLVIGRRSQVLFAGLSLAIPLIHSTHIHDVERRFYGFTADSVYNAQNDDDIVRTTFWWLPLARTCPRYELSLSLLRRPKSLSVFQPTYFTWKIVLVYFTISVHCPLLSPSHTCPAFVSLCSIVLSLCLFVQKMCGIHWALYQRQIHSTSPHCFGWRHAECSYMQ